MSLIKDSSVYSISNLFIRSSNLFVLLLTTKYLGPSGLGLLKTLQIIPSFSKYLSFDFLSITLRESYYINNTNDVNNLL